jgi:predicted Holliday junction resolvase-like endonuclease
MFELLFALALVVLVIFVWLYRRAWLELSELKFSKQSLSSKYGRMTEQFMPFMKDYPYDAQNFRFIGAPIDGLQFEPDRVVFIEFKSADGRLSTRQKEIKDLILKKKVEFKEVRI